MSFVVGLFAIALLPHLASAQESDKVAVRQPRVIGNGCPGDTARAILSPDGNTVTVLFDDFRTEAGGAVKSRADHKRCHLQLPIELKPGYSASLVSAAFRGFASIPAGGRADLDVRLNWERTPDHRRGQPQITGPFEDDFTFLFDVARIRRKWVPCAAQAEILLDTTVRLQTNPHFEHAFVSLDTLDAGTVTFALEFKACDDRERPRRGSPLPGERRPPRRL